MSRTVATVWHASLSTLATILYFLFVIPRWWELTGFSPHVLGTVLRIILGVLVGLMALPVAATLKHARKPEFGTPQLSLTLLTGSVVAHVVAGALIVATAVSEIWLSLDSAGMWLFGVYGAAAAIALLGIGAFYLSFVAEMPPPPPKPIKLKADKGPKPRWWAKKDTAAADDDAGDDDAEGAEDETDDAAEDVTDDAEGADVEIAEDDETEPVEPETAAVEIGESAGEEAPEPASTAATLRPTGKRRAKAKKSD